VRPSDPRVSDPEQATGDELEARPEGLRHRRLGIALHVAVILGSGFVALTTEDSTTRVASILVCAVAAASIVVLAIDPAGRRRRSQG
jgi:hypothetical protein